MLPLSASYWTHKMRETPRHLLSSPPPYPSAGPEKKTLILPCNYLLPGAERRRLSRVAIISNSWLSSGPPYLHSSILSKECDGNQCKNDSICPSTVCLGIEHKFSKFAWFDLNLIHLLVDSESMRSDLHLNDKVCLGIEHNFSKFTWFDLNLIHLWVDSELNEKVCLGIQHKYSK